MSGIEVATGELINDAKPEPRQVPREALCYALSFYYLNTEGVKGVSKRPALWGEIEITDGSGKSFCHSPLVYLQKPAWIDDKTFMKIITAISLNLPKGINLNVA